MDRTLQDLKAEDCEDAKVLIGEVRRVEGSHVDIRLLKVII
jgi:hypothetical protein